MVWSGIAGHADADDGQLLSARSGIRSRPDDTGACGGAVPGAAGARPAEADLQRFFRVTPPSVHQMVLTLARSGLIRRQTFAGMGGKEKDAPKPAVA
jgi:hypothetical protein